jgi:hypothetical protein
VHVSALATIAGGDNSETLTVSAEVAGFPQSPVVEH